MDSNDPPRPKVAEMHVDGDLIVVRSHGVMLLESVQKFVETLKQVHRQYGRYFLLVDLSDAIDLPPTLRRMLAETEAVYPPAAAAFIGSGINARGMNALFQGAIVALGGRRRQDQHFASEPEARAWLGQERQRLSITP